MPPPADTTISPISGMLMGKTKREQRKPDDGKGKLPIKKHPKLPAKASPPKKKRKGPHPAMPCKGKRYQQVLQQQADKHLAPGPGSITFTEQEWTVNYILMWRLNYSRQQL